MFRAFSRPLLTQAILPAVRVGHIPRPFSSTAYRLSDRPPSIFGPGSPPGAVPTDEAQATGLDRLQLLGLMEGIDVFNQKPPEMTRQGTLADPIIIPSLAKERIVGCSGFPPDSHDALWITLRHNRKEGRGRCKECGNVFKLDFQGLEHEDSHHH